MIVLEAVEMIERLNVFPLRGILKDSRTAEVSFLHNGFLIPVNEIN